MCIHHFLRNFKLLFGTNQKKLNGIFQLCDDSLCHCLANGFSGWSGKNGSPYSLCNAYENGLEPEIHDTQMKYYNSIVHNNISVLVRLAFLSFLLHSSVRKVEVYFLENVPLTEWIWSVCLCVLFTFLSGKKRHSFGLLENLKNSSNHNNAILFRTLKKKWAISDNCHGRLELPLE